LVLLKKNIRTLNYLNTNQKRNSNEWLAENSWQFAEVKGHAAPIIASGVLMVVKSKNTTPVIELFNLSERETEILKCLTEGMSLKWLLMSAPLV